MQQQLQQYDVIDFRLAKKLSKYLDLLCVVKEVHVPPSSTYSENECFFHEGAHNVTISWAVYCGSSKSRGKKGGGHVPKWCEGDQYNLISTSSACNPRLMQADEDRDFLSTITLL